MKIITTNNYTIMYVLFIWHFDGSSSDALRTTMRDNIRQKELIYNAFI